MADYNQENQSRRYNQEWDQNRDRQHREGQRGQNRGYEDINYNRQEGDFDNPQSGNQWDNYRTRSLSGNMGNYNRANFIPDNDENRGDFEQQRWGNRGRYENRGSQGGWGSSGERMDQTNYGAGQYGGSNEYQPGGYARVGNTGANYGRSEGERMNRPDYDNPYGRAGANYGDYSTYGERYRGDYNENPQYRRTGANRDRDWWDRTTDEVSSWFGDEDAERRRRMDKMQSGEHKGKGPKGYSRSGERIREDVCDRLSEDSFVDASDIDVRIEGNDVILSGSVHSREEKRRAEDLAERISGVSNVQNQIRVERSSEQHSDQTERSTGRNRGNM